MAIANKVHWNYFLALERDMELASRYVEFADANIDTYSIEFAHLLFAAASEVDVIAKLLCRTLNSQAPRQNINDYRSVLTTQLSELIDVQVLVPRYALTLTPWDAWADNQNPAWWRSYNNVKHERDIHYQEATLKNAINALAGLMAMSFYYYSYPDLQPGRPVDRKQTTRYLLPASSLLSFPSDYYHKNLIF